MNLQSSGRNLQRHKFLNRLRRHNAGMLRQKSVAQDAEVSTVPTLCKFDHSCDDDHDEREDLGHRADDLKNGAPFHFHGVHKGQQAWLKQREQSETARGGLVEN